MKTTFVLLLSLLGGCIVYDTTGARECGRCRPEDAPSSDAGGLGSTDDERAADTARDDDEAANAPAFTLTPDAAEPGAALIASLTADGQTIDFERVVGAEAFGPAELLVTEALGNQLLVGLEVSSAASPGTTVDLLLRLTDGSALLADDALRIVSDDADAGDDSASESPGDAAGDTGDCD